MYYKRLSNIFKKSNNIILSFYLVWSYAHVSTNVFHINNIYINKEENMEHIPEDKKEQEVTYKKKSIILNEKKFKKLDKFLIVHKNVKRYER